MASKAMFVVDSSVLIAFYLTTDAQHNLARKVLSDIERATILLHPFVLQEVVTVLTYKSGLQLAKNFINDIQQADNVSITNVNIEAALTSFKGIRQKISLTDNTLINLAVERKAQLLTFDQQMLAAAKKMTN